jgi:hypothetical protein
VKKAVENVEIPLLKLHQAICDSFS